MPSGSKKKKSAKRKSKASVSTSHQGWLRSHLQMLKTPSFGTGGTKGKENHAIVEKEIGKEKISSQYKGVEASTMREMGASEIGGSYVAAMEVAGAPWAEEPQKVEDLKRLVAATDRSAEGFQKAEDLKGAASGKLPEESATEDSKVENSVGFEGKAREGQELNEVEVDRSSDDVVTLPVIEVVETAEHVAEKAELIEGKARVGEEQNEVEVDRSLDNVATSPVIEVVETLECVAEKAELIDPMEVDVSACEKEDKMIVDANESEEAPLDVEKDAIMPKVEIPHPPLVVRRASLWNCCGFLEVFTSSQH